MNLKRIFTHSIVFLFLLGLLIACQPQTAEVTRVVTQVEEVPVEVTRLVTETIVETITETIIQEVDAASAPLGSAERPIKVLFVPSVEADVIITGGELLAQQLEEATGYHFEVSVPNSYAATIEAMCASPDDTIGFIPALGYVLANERCGVQVGNAAVRNGWPVYWAQIVVRTDSGIETLEDLAGRSWGTPSVTSTSGYLVPVAQLSAAGVEPGEIVETGGHTQAMVAVAQGDVDFATSFYSPPLMPGRVWNPEIDDPEIWRDADASPELIDGRALVAGGPAEGGYRVLDARVAAMETIPTIFDETEILAISDPIPNDTVSFGPLFPLSQAQAIIQALADYVSSDACLNPPEGVLTLCSDSFYSWTGAEPTTDAAYDPIRFMISALGITEQEILGE